MSMRTMNLSSLLTGGTYLACLTQLPCLLFPKGAKTGEGDTGRRCLLCKPPCPALLWVMGDCCQEGILGGDTRQKWQRAEAGAVKFHGSRAFNCSISHTCHAGSSLATGTKKNTVKKRSIPCHPPHQQLRQVLLLSTLGQCWLLKFSLL